MCFIRKILLFLLLVTLVSCIGKLEDANPEETKGAELSTTFIEYAGIVDAVPIAHDKVEIFFNQAPGDATKLTYLISYDGSSDLKAVRASSLRPDYRGYLRYTYYGLDVDTKYYFRVQVKNDDGERSDSPKFISTATFINKTADFFGISAVENMPGSDGINSAKILWPEATQLGTPQTPKETDVSEYIVTLLDADALTPADFDNPAFGEPIRKIFHVNNRKVNLIATGLKGGTRYLARVRAIQHGYLTNSADSSYKIEANTKYVEFSTLSSNMGELDVDTSLIYANLIADSNGRAIQINWDTVSGAFDHFRIYYNKVTDGAFGSYVATKDVSCSGKETANPLFYCKNVEFDQVGTEIVDLEPFSDYEVNVLICQNFECSNFLKFDRKTVATDINLVSFSGINEVKLATSMSEIGTVTLEYDVPDTSTGGADGLLVEVEARTTGVPAVATILNNPASSNSTGIEVQPFTLGSGEVTVTGIDYFSAENYCFYMYPYLYINGEVKFNSTGKVKKCIQPQLLPPSDNEFVGITGIGTDPASGFTEVQWAPPTAGLYSNYYLFVKTGGGFFNYGDAIGTDPTYVRFKLPHWQTSMTLMLPTGSYSAGVLTHLNLNGVYSDFNTGIVFFNVP